MKRIKIDSDLARRVEKFNKELFSERQKNFVKPLANLRVLREKFYNKNQNNFVNYICLIEKNYFNLLNLKPSEFKKYINEFNLIFNFESLPSFKSKNKDDKDLIIDLCYHNSCSIDELKTFADKIIEAMRYDDYRDSEYPKFISELGWNVKTCFYCNYAGTLTVKKDKKYKTYYDLDHVLPKSMYPFLETSFFNFIPCCASCNRSKSNQLIPNLNPFYEIHELNINVDKVFQITQKSKAQFYVDSNKSHINIKVSDKINNVKKDDMNKIVDLELLYNTQKYEVAEILWKKKIYEEAYIKNIQSSFSKLKLKKHEINRVLWGTDLNEDNINDRPLSKFKQDLINDK
ncbi:HNH endonuclease [Myroides injenensis]|uniref:HNH endonuclease n=1 Tax=Myroides injenensis TaxID=1183151 RepID=UPI000289F780|nr:HNH endonuclease domain-containing protein [Myroides injenensis]